MSNVAPPHRDVPSRVKLEQRGWVLRVMLWLLAMLALALVFMSYQQIDLAIAWLTAKLC